jgi:hypothetical protein
MARLRPKDRTLKSLPLLIANSPCKPYQARTIQRRMKGLIPCHMKSALCNVPGRMSPMPCTASLFSRGVAISIFSARRVQGMGNGIARSIWSASVPSAMSAANVMGEGGSRLGMIWSVRMISSCPRRGIRNGSLDWMCPMTGTELATF